MSVECIFGKGKRQTNSQYNIRKMIKTKKLKMDFDNYECLFFYL